MIKRSRCPVCPRDTDRTPCSTLSISGSNRAGSRRSSGPAARARARSPAASTCWSDRPRAPSGSPARSSPTCRRGSCAARQGRHAAPRQPLPAQLSGGQRQRIGPARGLALRPAVLLPDEVTSGLDPDATASILRLLTDLREELGVTVVVITHEMDVVRSVADVVAHLDHGRIVEQGPVDRVLRESDSALSTALLPVPPSAPDGSGRHRWQLRYRGEVDPSWIGRLGGPWAATSPCSARRRHRAEGQDLRTARPSGVRRPAGRGYRLPAGPPGPETDQGVPGPQSAAVPVHHHRPRPGRPAQSHVPLLSGRCPWPSTPRPGQRPLVPAERAVRARRRASVRPPRSP